MSYQLSKMTIPRVSHDQPPLENTISSNKNKFNKKTSLKYLNSQNTIEGEQYLILDKFYHKI
jgi:hypothetical protein